MSDQNFNFIFYSHILHVSMVVSKGQMFWWVGGGFHGNIYSLLQLMANGGIYTLYSFVGVVKLKLGVVTFPPVWVQRSVRWVGRWRRWS